MDTSQHSWFALKHALHCPLERQLREGFLLVIWTSVGRFGFLSQAAEQQPSLKPSMWMRQQLALASHSTGVGVFASNASCPCILTHGAQAQGEAHGRPLGIVLLDLALTCYSIAPPRPPGRGEGRHRAHTAAQGFLFSLFSEYCATPPENAARVNSSVFCLLVFPNTEFSLISNFLVY